MALDAVVFPQDPFPYHCSFRDYFQGVEDEICSESIISTITDTHLWSYNDQLAFHYENEEEKSLLTILDNKINNQEFLNWQDQESSPVVLNPCVNDQYVQSSNSSSEELHRVLEMPIDDEQQQKDQVVVSTRRKRRRTKPSKNKEEVENQRMTHIAVERNRRKQMNEYLAVLRSLMPSSYAQRGDQASIIGGAINFVKELEQLLQTLDAKKSTNNHTITNQQDDQQDHKAQELSSFSNFFTFPQYTTKATTTQIASSKDDKSVENEYKAAAAADIEVTIVESHANVKILAKRCPKQLVKLVNSFQSLRLTVQHLNVSSLDHMVLYSVSVKVEEGCKLNTVDEIAAAVNEMLHKIEEENQC